LRVLLDDLLFFIASRGIISIERIQDIFNVDSMVLWKAIEFLVHFDFVELDVSREHVMISETCRPLFEEFLH
jgi:hypothetical protein